MARSLPETFRAALAGLALLALVAGCASNRAPGSSPQESAANIVTQSDETQAHRRARLRIELAIGYFEQGKTTVALDEVKQALAADPNYADAYNLRGLIYMRLDDPAAAEDSFRRAIALNPGDGDSLHNYGWLLCQQSRYADAETRFKAALELPRYNARAKTLMTMGLCEQRAGQRVQAEQTLLKAYELDAGNPVIGYNIAVLLVQRDDYNRARFYIRRVNNSASANAESLWLGIKIERKLGNREAMNQLADQLQQRFPQARETLAYERGNFNE